MRIASRAPDKRLLWFRHIRSLGFAIIASLTACGCFVSSSSPVGTTVAVAVDPLLNGMWKGSSGEDVKRTYLTFFPQSDGLLTVMMLQVPTIGDNGGWSTFTVRPAQLGAWHYIDAQQIEQDGKPAQPSLGHIPVLYTVGQDGQLALYMMDEARTKSAIKAGQIAGTIEPGQFGDVTLTATPAALDAFLRTDRGRALFTKPFAVLERVR